MALYGNWELFDFLYWEVKNQKLANYVRKSVTEKTKSGSLPFKITADGNKVIYKGGATDDLDHVYDSADDVEELRNSYNDHYMYYSEKDRKQYVKRIMELFGKIKSTFADDFAALNPDMLSETLSGHDVEITYNGAIYDDFDVYQWKILNPMSCYELNYYADDECSEETTEDFKKIKEHLQKYEGLHESGNIKLNIEINDDELVFTWFNKENGLIDSLEEALEYFDEFPKAAVNLINSTMYCNEYYDCECFLNNRTNIIEHITWSIDEAINDFCDSPYENFDMNNIKEMLKDSKTVIVKYEYAAYNYELG